MADQKFIDAVLNATAFDSKGDKVGKVDQLFLDERTGEPTFIAVNTGLFGMSSSLVPLEGATVNGDEVRLAHVKDVITDAPSIADSDEGLTPEQEAKLYAHYGLEYTAPTAVDHDRREVDAHARERAAHADIDHTEKTGDDEIIRSEEQMNIHKDKVAAGRVRLHKYVVTETKNVEVPVSREEVRVEREKISPEEAARLGDSRIGEDSAEMILHEERVHVDKEAVPVERINLEKETVTENRTVSEELKKERIDVDTDADIEKKHK